MRFKCFLALLKGPSLMALCFLEGKLKLIITAGLLADAIGGFLRILFHFLQNFLHLLLQCNSWDVLYATLDYRHYLGFVLDGDCEYIAGTLFLKSYSPIL